jgi:hypothetical protein
VALVENWHGDAYISRYNPRSPIPLRRQLMEEANCFRVVDRAAGLAASEREQELAARGAALWRAGSVLGGLFRRGRFGWFHGLGFAEELGRTLAGFG